MARKLKGLVAAVFAALLAVALVPSAAFALEGTSSLTVSGLNAGDTVTLYKVASTTVNDDNTLKKAWDVAPDATTTVADYEGATEAGKKTIANAIAANVADDDIVATKTTTAAGSLTFDGLEAGLYYAKVVNADDASVVYQNTLIPVNLKVDGSAWAYADPETVALKKSPVSIAKQVSADGSTYADSTDGVSTNGTVYYKLTVTVPQYNGAANRTFSVTDVLPAGIELDAATVKVDGVAVTPVVDGQKMTVDLTDKLATKGGSTVTITYAATLTGTTVVAGGRVNTATLTFSANSYDDSTKTTEDTAQVNNGGVKVVKKDEDGNKLQGAVFQLKSGTTVLATGTSDANGNITFDVALATGTYTLSETSAPAGYKPVADQTVSVTADSNAYTTVDVVDPKGTSGWLPSTGEAGTFGITLLGVLAVAGVAAMHVSGRKQN